MTEQLPLGVPVQPLINAAGHFTRLGGSRPSAAVLSAMQEIAQHYVDLTELQRAVGTAIATATHNDAALVTSGAHAALFLATAACLRPATVGTAVEREADLPTGDVIMLAPQPSAWNGAVQMAGGRIRRVGTASGTSLSEFKSALTETVAAVIVLAGPSYELAVPPIEAIVDAARRRQVPVIVDAAAQLPPIENLWRYTHLGADLVAFSGGKALRGPQCTGLLLGRGDLVAAAASLGPPGHGWGRPMKVGKEELMGVLAAVLEAVRDDPQRIRRHCDRIIGKWRSRLKTRGARVTVQFPGEAGRPLPLAVVTFCEGRITGHAVREALQHSAPRIVVLDADETSITLNPETVDERDADIIGDRILAILKAA